MTQLTKTTKMTKMTKMTKVTKMTKMTKIGLRLKLIFVIKTKTRLNWEGND